MRKCYQRYIRNSALEAQAEVVVLDIGGADVNGGYRQVFDGPQFRYVIADIADGEGVDMVLEEPYRLQLADASVDIVVSGQMLEHCEFFWLSFAEMVRVLKPAGFLFLIAPSAGPIHRYPVDCYRFYPDSYRALAKHANCLVAEIWMDERGPWRDLVGVFHKQTLPPRASADAVQGSSRQTPFDTEAVPAGPPEEEATRGEGHYLDVLANIHSRLEPTFYLEVGVRHGRSLALAKCPAVGVDPLPDIEAQLSPETKLIAMASDDFFDWSAKEVLSAAPNLVFIDGMHLFEYALRDFMHVERSATPETLIVIDDIFPAHPAQAERRRRTRTWTGDVWKLHRCLAEIRPELFLLPLDTAPTGLLLVAGLDPANRALWDNYNPIVRQFAQDDMTPSEAVLGRDGAISAAHPALEQILTVLKERRGAGRSPREIVAQLVAVLAKHRDSESFSGDDLIMSRLADSNRDLQTTGTTHNVASTSQLQKTETDLAEALQRIQRLDRQNAALLNSTSWRATEPLRRLSRLIRRLA